MNTSKKKPVLVCVFAHPDDEAFGPAGTIALYAKTHDVYILCATRGEAGRHTTGEVTNERENELLESAKILGVKKVIFLDCIDGTLNNSQYHLLADKIRLTIEPLHPKLLLTLEPRGVSGHIDHIVVSMVTTFVFERYAPNVKTLLYFCHLDQHLAAREAMRKQYFVYFPPGYPISQIGKIVDTTSVWELKKKAMFSHTSQIEDAIRILSFQEKLPRKEYFLVLKK